MNLKETITTIISGAGESMRQYFIPSDLELERRIMDLFEQEEGALHSLEVAFRSGTFPLTALVALERLSADDTSPLRKETLINYPITSFTPDGTMQSSPVVSLYSKRH